MGVRQAGRLGAVLWLAACQSATSGDRVPTEIVITPANARLTSLGETVVLTAEARDDRGQPVSGVTFVWTSSNSNVAAIDSAGVVTATGNGSAVILASVGRAAGQAGITVSQTPRRVRITPENPILTGLGRVGAFQLEAVAFDARDNRVQGLPFTWTSSNPAVIEVNREGEIRALARGSATVLATTGSVAGTSTVTSDPPAIPRTGLRGSWTFRGNANDDGGSNHHGTLRGPAFDADRFGITGAALRFDGDDWVDLGDILNDVRVPFSLSAWVIQPAAGRARGIFTADDSAGVHSGFWLETRSSGALAVHYGDGGASGPASRRSRIASAPVPNGRWTHVAAVVRGPTDMSLYVDGLEVAGSYEGAGGSLVRGPAVMRIGVFSLGAGPQFFDTHLDDVRVYDRALGATEIRELYVEGGWPGLAPRPSYPPAIPPPARDPDR